MTHILLNIEYMNKDELLYNVRAGEKMIYNWVHFNHHQLMVPPTMVVFPPPSQNEYSLSNDDYYQGYTGFGILKESHISIHTYPEENKVSIDFYSCKNLNIPKNKEFIKNYFIKNNGDKIKFQVIKR